jgi:hypothetical protein
MMTARVLLTVLVAIQGTATVLVDFNRTHATNPTWPGRARFHLVWQSLNQPLFAILIALLIWWPGAYAGERFYLAALLTAIPCLGFVLAQASREAYGGTLSDPNGIPPFRFRVSGKSFEVDGNAAAVYCALALLLVLVALFHYANRSI